MRELKGTDIFKIFPIVKKTGALKALKELFKDEMGKKRDGRMSEEMFESIGVELFADMAETVMGEIGKAEKEVNEFLASLTGTDKKTIETLPPAEYMALIVSFFQKEELKTFLPQLKQLIK